MPRDVAAGYTRDAFGRRQDVRALQNTGPLRVTGLVIQFGRRGVNCQPEPGLSAHVPVKPSVEKIQGSSPNGTLQERR